MTTKHSIRNVVISIAILGLLIWLSAVANPPQKAGNPQVPRLLAEISELNAKIEALEATIQNIEVQNADLETQIEDLMAAIQDLETFAPVPKTGKTKYWVNFGNTIDFAHTEQDGI
jgi:TolA-binding protein